MRCSLYQILPGDVGPGDLTEMGSSSITFVASTRDSGKCEFNILSCQRWAQTVTPGKLHRYKFHPTVHDVFEKAPLGGGKSMMTPGHSQDG